MTLSMRSPRCSWLTCWPPPRTQWRQPRASSSPAPKTPHTDTQRTRARTRSRQGSTVYILIPAAPIQSSPSPPGPKEKLDDTVHAQPALLLADLAAAELLRARDPAAAAGCGAAAGLSLGEYAALVWAGAIEFEDAIQVQYRASIYAFAWGPRFNSWGRLSFRPHGGLARSSLKARFRAALSRFQG